MAAPAPTPLPRGGGNGTDDGPTLAEIYSTAVAEYHHQIDYNWGRTQYLLALNVAILAAGSAVAGSTRFAAVIYATGIVTAALSALFTKLIRPLYHQARDRLRRVEHAAGVDPDLTFDTTPSLGNWSQRIKAHWLVYWLFGVIGVADAIGLVIVITR